MVNFKLSEEMRNNVINMSQALILFFKHLCGGRFYPAKYVVVFHSYD